LSTSYARLRPSSTASGGGGEKGRRGKRKKRGTGGKEDSRKVRGYHLYKLQAGKKKVVEEEKEGGRRKEALPLPSLSDTGRNKR